MQVRPPGVEPPRRCEGDWLREEQHNALFDIVEGMFRVTVAATLVQRTGAAARETAQVILDCDAQLAATRTAARTSVDGIGTTGESIAIVVLFWWLARLNDPAMVEGVVEWVRIELGPDAAQQAARASSLSRTAFDALMIIGLREELGADFIPALTWLAAGAVARYGAGDVDWLPNACHPVVADR